MTVSSTSVAGPVARLYPGAERAAGESTRLPQDFSGWLDGGMRFLMTINGGGRQPDAELYAKMGEFIDELSKAGILVATGGLAATGTHVRAEGGKLTFTDGPYAEAKETIVSFAVLDLPSHEAAIELSHRFWEIHGDGEGDIRQIYGPE
jgi:hypothetical protein